VVGGGEDQGRDLFGSVELGRSPHDDVNILPGCQQSFLKAGSWDLGSWTFSRNIPDISDCAQIILEISMVFKLLLQHLKTYMKEEKM
jgi:hypothetical protein